MPVEKGKQIELNRPCSMHFEDDLCDPGGENHKPLRDKRLKKGKFQN